jgi:CBS domain containing-hemolysin-like protein
MTVLVVLWALLFLAIRRLSVLLPVSLARQEAEDIEEYGKEVRTSHARHFLMIDTLVMNDFLLIIAVFPLFLCFFYSWMGFQELWLSVLVVVLSDFIFLFRFGRVTDSESVHGASFGAGLYCRFVRLFYWLRALEAFLSSPASLREQMRERWRKVLLSLHWEYSEWEDEQELELEQRKILANLDGLFQKRVDSIMTSHSHVVFLSSELTVDEALSKSMLYGYSRFPVIDKENRVLGIYRANQIEQLGEPDVSILDRLDREIRVEAGGAAFGALKLLQKKKRQLAMVYEGVRLVGLVTIEDILEELVGDIKDEFDQGEFQQLTEGVYILEASVPAERVFQYFRENVQLEGDVVTLNEYLQGVHGRVPSNGTVFAFENMVISVLTCSETAVHKVRIDERKDR